MNALKVPVVTCKDYIIYFENYEGYTFVHCDCFGWSKTIKNSLKEDWEQLVKLHRRDIYALHEIDDNKHLKFLNLFGFTYHMPIEALDGTEKHFYVRKQHG